MVSTVLREEEIFALLVAAKEHRDKVLVRTLYSAGLRVSELCRLRWQDVVPTVGGKAVLVVYGKGGHQREAEISAATHTALQELRGGAGPAPVITSTAARCIGCSSA